MTIAWTDPAGAAELITALDVSTPKLKNDIELRMYKLDSSGNETTEYLPFNLNPSSPGSNATTGANHLDNVEQVRSPNESSAYGYRVKIFQASGTSITNDGSGGQRVSIILSNNLILGYNLQYPLIDSGERIDS